MTAAEANRQRFTQMYVDAYRGDFALIREIMSPAFVCRNPLQPTEGVDALVRLLQSQIDAFEDLEFKVRHSFASEDGFGIAYIISGRHIGPIFGVQPSGQRFEVAGVSIHEIVDGYSMDVYSSANFIEVLTNA
nr:ester cyclase [Sphingomonas sp. Y57]